MTLKKHNLPDTGPPKAMILITPVVPFFPSYFGVSLLKLNIRKQGTLIIKGLLRNLES